MQKTRFFMGCVFAGLSLTVLAQDQKPTHPATEQTEITVQNPREHAPLDPGVTSPKLIQVQVEFIELPHDRLTKLLFLHSPKSADATELRKLVQELVVKNDANILETQIAVTRSGELPSAESVHEFIYPTEYEPAIYESKKEAIKQDANPPRGPSIPATPTAFETRNLGSVLEFEATLRKDGQVIDLSFAPEIVWHTGDTKWAEIKDAKGTINIVSMPDVYSLRVRTWLSCISGQYTFVAALSPKDSRGDPDMTRKVMVFAKCDVLPVK